jgi:hypothetical protein
MTSHFEPCTDRVASWPISPLLSGASSLRCEGEVVASVNAIARTLKTAGADFYVLGDLIESASSGLTEAEM